MNGEYDNGFAVTKYVWIAIATSVVMILGSVWMASKATSGMKIPPDIFRPTTPTRVIHVPQMNRQYPENTLSSALPDLSGGRGSVYVAVAEVGRGKRVRISDLDIESSASEPRRNPVEDMFPVAPVARAAVQSAPAPVKPVASQPASGIDFAGRRWTATCAIATSEQVDLIQEGSTSDGRAVYGLSGDVSGQALFLESEPGSGVYEIYRVVS